MSSHFAPCEGCGRHIRVAEKACPFCDHATSASFRATPRPIPPTKRLSRAALLVFSAASTSAVACGASVSDGPAATTDGGSDVADTNGTVSDAALYGLPADTAFADSGVDTGTPETTVAAYGGPPDTGKVDSGTSDTTTAPDADVDTSTDAPAPPYGAPP